MHDLTIHGSRRGFDRENARFFGLQHITDPLILGHIPVHNTHPRGLVGTLNHIKFREVGRLDIAHFLCIFNDKLNFNIIGFADLFGAGLGRKFHLRHGRTQEQA